MPDEVGTQEPDDLDRFLEEQMRDPEFRAAWNHLDQPPCQHCGARHGDFATRLVAQIGPKICDELAAARARMERQIRRRKTLTDMASAALNAVPTWARGRLYRWVCRQLYVHLGVPKD